MSEQPHRSVVEGIVRAQRPSGLYEVEVEGPHRITAHIGGGLDRNFVRVLVGERVHVELSGRDRSRGRIVKTVGRSGTG
jgi:translation initiation factor IF-1